MIDLDQFIRDRDEALLSLDADKIVAYAKKYGAKMPAKDDPLFWLAVHKAITANLNLPIEFRAASIAYLARHGMRPLGEEDL